MSMITISYASRELGIAPSTILYYEKKGVITPERDTSGRRIFSLEDLEKIKKHRKQLRRFGRD